jgi:integrase
MIFSYLSEMAVMLSKQLRGYRHVSLLGDVRDVTRPLRLLNSNGDLIPQFGIYAELLSKGAFNTYKSYCYSLAGFLDYLCEAVCQIGARKGKSFVENSDLREIIRSWDDYLTLGPAAENDIATWVDSQIPSRCVSPYTSQLKHAALKKFIELSEKVRQQTAELVHLGLLDETVDREPLFAIATKFSKVNAYERNALLKSSMLAGVINKSQFKRKTSILDVGPRNTKASDMRKIFPLDMLPKLIENMKSRRDKTIYSLFGATGCRPIEGLQLLWKDIDIENREIRFIDPAVRMTDPSYLALTQSERKRLAWKGRLSPIPLRIEPFWSMFFDHLKSYVEMEYCHHNRHGFVFQILKGSKKGQPYFLSCPSSRGEIFHTAGRNLELPELVDGPHSIRGGYATYLLNYYPLADGGIGLPLEVVQKSLGHRDVRSTLKYAIRDQELAQIDMAYANSVAAILGVKPFAQIKIEHLKAQISKLETLVKEEK